jgi:hypothetical protein
LKPPSAEGAHGFDNASNIPRLLIRRSSHI